MRRPYQVRMIVRIVMPPALGCRSPGRQGGAWASGVKWGVRVGGLPAGRRPLGAWSGPTGDVSLASPRCRVVGRPGCGSEGAAQLSPSPRPLSLLPDEFKSFMKRLPSNHFLTIGSIHQHWGNDWDLQNRYKLLQSATEAQRQKIQRTARKLFGLSIRCRHNPNHQLPRER